MQYQKNKNFVIKQKQQSRKLIACGIQCIRHRYKNTTDLNKDMAATESESKTSWRTLVPED